MNILAQKDFEEQVRSALSRERATNRRIERDIKKAQSTGNISFFLKKQAESNETLRSAIATINPSFQQSQQQSSVEYKSPISVQSAKPIDQRIQQIQPDPQTILPPRPDDNDTHFLSVINTELKWEKIGDIPDGIKFGDLLYWDPESGENGAWVLFHAEGSNNGSIFYWAGDEIGWRLLEAPTQSNSVKVLGFKNGELVWLNTESCDDQVN